MALCWQLGGMSGTEKAVLIALADRADDVGLCWPSVATLAQMTCFTDRAVRQCVRTLTEKGYLRVHISPGGKSNKYIVDPEPRSVLTQPNATPNPELDSAFNPEPRSPGTTFPRNHVPSNPEPHSANPEPRSAKPSRTNKEPKVIDIRPTDVEPALWDEWKAHRKAKRSAVTQGVLNSLRIEAEKLNWSLEQALRKQIDRGWTGFEADWCLPTVKTGSQKFNGASRAVSNDDWVPPEMRSNAEKIIEAERV